MSPKKMIDSFTLSECKKNQDVLDQKIKSIEFAISQTEKMIRESSIDLKALTFLRRKVADSKQDLEILYLIKYNN